jgi:hypothetical protein
MTKAPPHAEPPPEGALGFDPDVPPLEASSMTPVGKPDANAATWNDSFHSMLDHPGHPLHHLRDVDQPAGTRKETRHGH